MPDRFIKQLILNESDEPIVENVYEESNPIRLESESIRGSLNKILELCNQETGELFLNINYEMIMSESADIEPRTLNMIRQINDIYSLATEIELYIRKQKDLLSTADAKASDINTKTTIRDMLPFLLEKIKQIHKNIRDMLSWLLTF